jgi:membrane protease YdiL (CAAX protease family)
MIASQFLFLFFTSLAAKPNGIQIFGPASPPSWTWAAAGAYVVLIGLSFWRKFWKSAAEQKDKTRVMLPENPDELWYWIAISFLAGITEEYAYRGIAYAAIYEMTGSLTVALAICVLAFTVGHAIYGWRDVIGIALFALLCHLAVLYTHTLSLVVAVHIAYDLVLGVLATVAFLRESQRNAAEAQAAV